MRGALLRPRDGLEISQIDRGEHAVWSATAPILAIQPPISTGTPAPVNICSPAKNASWSKVNTTAAQNDAWEHAVAEHASVRTAE